MRRLVYFVATTLDGMIAGPDGEIEFFPMGEHLAHQVATYPETLPVHLRKQLGADVPPRRFDAVVMGRRTYDLAFSQGITHPYAPLETVVFSRSLSFDAPVEGVRIVHGDAIETVSDMKMRPGNDIWLCGGGALAGQLLDVIDEVILKLNPIAIGTGTRAVGAPFCPREFQLREHKVFSTGVVWLTYDRVS